MRERHISSHQPKQQPHSLVTHLKFCNKMRPPTIMEKSTQLDRTRCPLDDAPLFVRARDCVMLQNFNRIERGYDTIWSVINRLTDLSALRLENHVAPFRRTKKRFGRRSEWRWKSVGRSWKMKRPSWSSFGSGNYFRDEKREKKGKSVKAERRQKLFLPRTPAQSYRVTKGEEDIWPV